MPALRRISVAACLAVLASAGLPAAAQEAKPEEKKYGWFDSAELGLVLTSGNTETSTFGLKNTLLRVWEKQRFEIKLGGIRVETTDRRLFAVGDSPGDFTVEEDNNTETTAENYYLNGRFDRTLSERFFWFAGAGWDRNRFAGIDNRYQVFAGVGNVWVDADRRKWRTDYSFTGTKEEDVVEPPDFDDTFFGVRLSSTFLQKFGDSGTYGNDTIIDENLNDTEDLRVNMTNWVAVNMSDHLALKVSLQWLFDNQPALQTVNLYPTTDPGGVGPPSGTVLAELDDLDTIFTTALVIKY